MNRFCFLLILYLFASSSLHSQVSKDEAGILVNNYLKKEIIGSRLYQKDSISLPNSIIKTFHKEIRTAEFKSWAFFLDKNPLAGWEHPCSYIFVDALTGNLLEKTWKMPPNDIENWSSLNEKQEYSSTKLFDFSKFKSSAKKSGINTENCYAVIISGGKNRWNNPSRYWNDCSAIYSTLVNVYGYEDDHIYSLISDGTDPSNDRKIDGGYDSSPLDLDGDGDHDTQYAATCDDISDVFDELSQLLDEDDYLFIFTTDHGGQQSGSDVYMLLWGYYEVMTDDEFADELDKVDAGEISIVMAQCNSGGFIDDLNGTNKVVATACDYNEYSYGMGEYSYNEFVYYWTSAVAGEDPDGNPVDADANNDGFVSMKEAFDYAELNDSKNETPQYDSNKYTLGENLTILGKEICVSTDFFHDFNLTMDADIFDCNIDVDNVTISNNADVLFDAENIVIIQKDFTISSGSTLIIQ